MKCVKCNAQATIHLENLDVCRGCFQKIIQKRVRKEIRIKKLIEKDDIILLIDDGSAEAKLSIYLLKETINLPVKIDVKKKSYMLGEEIKGKYTKIVIPWNADKEGEYLLNCFFEKEKPEYLMHFRIKTKTYLKPLVHVMHKEIAEFCKIKDFKFTEKKYVTAGSDMINKLQKEYPEITFSLVKSAEELKKVI